MKKLFLLFFMLAIACTKSKNNCSPKDAIIIAEREWIKLFGEGIKEKKPFTATLKSDSIWVIQGTLPSNFDGGVPYAEINAKTCQILEISHGK